MTVNGQVADIQRNEHMKYYYEKPDVTDMVVTNVKGWFDKNRGLYY